MNNEYRILSFEITKTKTNKPMARFVTENIKNGEKLNCVMWNEALEKAPPLAVGSIISVVDGELNREFNNFNIKEVALLREAKRGLSEEERDILFKVLLETSDKIKKVDLRQAVQEFISSNEEAIKTMPAAEKIHHNYIGGLLKHIIECINFAKTSMSSCAKEIDIDLVLAGCIMHDAGKIYEYIFDIQKGIIERNKEFQKVWINHLHWGFFWANERNLPELAHIIASHHGLRDWHALVEPMTNEAQLVFLSDMLSSRLGCVSVAELEKFDIKYEYREKVG